MSRMGEYIRTGLLAASMGATIPLADASIIAEVAGPLAAAATHYALARRRHPYWVETNREDGKLGIWIQRRWFSGDWPDSAQKIDYQRAQRKRNYDGTTFINDQILVGEVDPEHPEADEKVIDLVIEAKSAVKEFKSGNPEHPMDSLERRARRMIDDKGAPRKRKRLTRG